MDLKKIYIEKDNIKYCGFNATKIPILNNMLYILKTLFFIKKLNHGENKKMVNC